MTGRGKPRKTKSLDESKISQDEMKPTLPKSLENGFSHESKNGIDVPKKRIPSKESPLEEATKAPAKVTNPKTCTDKEKTTQQSTDRMQLEVLKGTARDPKKASKENSADIKEKLLHQSLEESTEMKPEAPKAPKKALIKVKTLKPCVPLESCADKTEVDSILYKTLEKLKIKQRARSDASEVVNNLIKDVIKHMKDNTTTFKEVQEPLRTGSYYENLKISNPDEFDVMLPIPVTRAEVKPFGDDGAFYSVDLKRVKCPLKKFQEGDTLSASKMLNEFREEVKKCAKKHPEWTLTRKKPGCPAVTLTTTVESVTISLDVVLSLVVKAEWPDFTKEGLKIEGWLGTKVRRQYRWMPYYLVPKYEGRGNVENNGVLAKDVWRVSFSHIEKDILRKHGSEKTCCEKAGERCCRKDCLKLMKHLLSQLKETDSSFDKFCSYHVKTTLLHACCTRTKDTEWRASDLNRCFQQLLNDFVDHLESGCLQNFFIPSQNLLSGPGKKKCKNLAARIQEECSNGFPIFK